MLERESMDLYTALKSFLEKNKDEQKILELFKRIRVMQNNGIQLKEAIIRASTEPEKQIKAQVSTKNLHIDNIPAYLAIRHRAKLLKLRAEGYGYGKIAKILAQRNVYNKKTGKAFSRSTIRRALKLLERK